MLEILSAGIDTRKPVTVIPDTEFITAGALCTALGVTEGTLINNTGNDWFRFIDGDKVLCVPRLGLRLDISFNFLYQKGLVYGRNDNGVVPISPAVNQYKTIDINGETFIVRLMKGAEVDPSTATYNQNNPIGSRDSEYTRLFQRMWKGETLRPPLGNYTPQELGCLDATGNIRYSTWCQEAHAYNSPTFRVYRSLDLPAWLATTNGNFRVSGNYHMVWRPVLELIKK